MKHIKYHFLLLIAKFISFSIKLLGKSSGTSFVGLVVLKLCPDFIRQSSRYIKKSVLTVTGTNGKTTTAGIISHVIKESKNSVLSNSKGANMLSGIANTFALNIYPFKRFDFAVLESDEAYLSKLYDYIDADYLLVTNLFRDQLDRYGELSTTAKKIQNAIDKNKQLQLILNGDDPLVVDLKSRSTKQPVYYGINSVEYMDDNITSHAPAEVINCPWCGNSLKYDERFYAQQGHYYCLCGYKRPFCKYNANIKIYTGYSIIELPINNQNYKFKVNLTGLYNAYNALAAIALSFELGITDIQSSLDSYKSEFGRSEVTEINGHKAIIQLIKNPTGASEVLKTVDKKSNILIAINDNYADGRDVSWLWDADFELLQGCSKKIITSGIRAYDMAVRLKYAGITDVKVIPNIDEAMKYMAKNSEDNITILPTYTALLHINKKNKKK